MAPGSLLACPLRCAPVAPWMCRCLADRSSSGWCLLLEAGPHPIRGTRVPNGGSDVAVRDRDTLVLTVAAAEQRIWSPWLTIEVTPRGDGAHVFARFSPHPSVWTGFAFAYLGLGVVLAFSLMFAFSQVIAGGAPWPLIVSAGTTFVIGALWLAGQLGKRLAHEQMEAMRGEYERALAGLGESSAPPT